MTVFADESRLIVAICAPRHPDRISQTMLRLVHDAELSQSLQFGSRVRRSEYLRSRAMFRLLSKSPMPLLNSIRGAPIWPDKMTGSISHVDGNVVLALSTNRLPIGIDFEQTGNESLSCREATFKMIHTGSMMDGDSRRIWRQLSAAPHEDRPRQVWLVFSGASLVARCAVVQVSTGNHEYALAIAMPNANQSAPNAHLRIINTPRRTALSILASLESGLFSNLEAHRVGIGA